MCAESTVLNGHGSRSKRRQRRVASAVQRAVPAWHRWCCRGTVIGTLLLLVVGTPLWLAIGGCGQSSTDPGETPPPPAAELVQSGWAAFEAGNFTAAHDAFVAALAQDVTLTEAQWGRGWSLARLRQYQAADAAMATAISLDASAADAQAGRALVAAALGEHTTALSAATSLLSLAPQYVFAHDAQVTAVEIRLLRAQLYYRSGDYAAAAADLDLLLPGAAPHSTDPHELLVALATLGGATTP